LQEVLPVERDSLGLQARNNLLLPPGRDEGDAVKAAFPAAGVLEGESALGAPDDRFGDVVVGQRAEVAQASSPAGSPGVLPGDSSGLGGGTPPELSGEDA